MSKLLIVIRKEYLLRVRTRAFVIGTILGPILIAAIIFGPALMAERTSISRQDVAVLDESGGAAFEVVQALIDSSVPEGTPEEERLLSLERYVPAPYGTEEEAHAVLSARVEAGEIDGYLVLRSDFLQSGRCTYYGEQLSGVIGVEVLESVLDQTIQQRRMERLGIRASDLDQVMRGAELELRYIGDEAGEKGLESRLFVGIAMIMGLYFMIIFYGQFTMQAVIEDKSSRVVEVMLASVTPTQLMIGKIVGQGLVGLSQFLLWVIFAAVLANVGGRIADLELELGLIGLDLWLYFGLFFILGYFLYSTIYAGVGALCSSTQDAQQFAGPITMMIVLPMLMLQVAIRNPDTGLAVGMSLFPLFTPILMFIRIVVGKPPLWQILLSIVLLAGSALFMARVAGKLFRLSILDFGKAPSWGQLVKLLRAPE
jgi:ABC-2 type transport system permease protein